MYSKPLTVFLSLGSNLNHGDLLPQQVIDAALEEISKFANLKATSSFYKSPAWPAGTDAPDYLNVTVEIETILSPMELLGAIWSVETNFGRKRNKKNRWASRTLDVDIISYADLVTEGEYLTIPHPRFDVRDFVILPLKEIAPEWKCPKSNRTITEIYDAYLEAGNTIGAIPVSGS